MSTANLTPIAYNEARLAKQAAEGAAAAIAAYSPIKSIQQVIGTNASWNAGNDGGIAEKSLNVAINPVAPGKTVIMPLRTQFTTAAATPQSIAYRLLNANTVKCLSIGSNSTEPGEYGFVVVEYK